MMGFVVLARTIRPSPTIAATGKDFDALSRNIWLYISMILLLLLCFVCSWN